MLASQLSWAPELGGLAVASVLLHVWEPPEFYNCLKSIVEYSVALHKLLLRIYREKMVGTGYYYGLALWLAWTGYSQVSTDIHGDAWLSRDIQGYASLCMDVRGFLTFIQGH